MTRTIAQIIDDVIASEGGYVDHPHDRGGPTKFGITEEVARATGYAGAMRDLPRQIAVDIYTHNYVRAPGFDLLIPISEAIATEMIDTGVLMGPGTAGRFLQRALAALADADAQALKVDGRCGPATRFALKQIIDRRGSDGIAVVLRMLNAQQMVRFIEIVEADASQKAFLYGWGLKRVVM